MRTCVALLLIGTTACLSSYAVAAPSQTRAEPQAAPSQPEPPPPTPPAERLTKSAHVAIFGGEYLEECWTATVDVVAPGELPQDARAVSIAADMVLEDLLTKTATGQVHALSRAHLADFLGMLLTQDHGWLKERMVALAQGQKPARRTDKRSAKASPTPTAPPTPQEVQALILASATATRVTASLKDSAARLYGKATANQVDSCDFDGRRELGVCEIPLSGSSPPDRSISVNVTRKIFGLQKTVDSEDGLRACLEAGGRWSAPDPDSPEVARLRARLRGKRLMNAARALGADF